MFLSHDVVSLFTNTSINETLDIIKKQLEADTKLKLWTSLNVDDITELLKFIVTTGKSGVTCNGKSLHGMVGTANYSQSTNNLQTEIMEEICR